MCSMLPIKNENFKKKKKTGGNPLNWNIKNLNSQLCLKYMPSPDHTAVKFFWAILILMLCTKK